MARRTERNAPDDAAVNAGNEDDATAPVTPKEVLSAFLTALWGLGVYKVTQKNVLQSIVGYCENTWDFDRQLVRYINGLPIVQILY